MNKKQLAILQDAYEVLANIHNNWSGRHTQKGQDLLCRLRDEIATQTGASIEEVQDQVNHIQW